MYDISTEVKARYAVRYRTHEITKDWCQKGIIYDEMRKIGVKSHKFVDSCVSDLLDSGFLICRMNEETGLTEYKRA